MFRKSLRQLLSLLYKVQINGLENLEQAGERVLIVANHTSFLDPVLLWAFLPEDITFGMNTHIAKSPWIKPFLRFGQFVTLDPTNPMSIKSLTQILRENRRVVLFPEGRITVTGTLMKVYDGAGLIADKASAPVLPVRIDGAQYTPFSRMGGILRQRWFPAISLNILPPQTLAVPAEIKGDERRERLGAMLEDVMSEMIFATADCQRNLFQALLDARTIHGGNKVILEDMQRTPVTYNGLITRILALCDPLECCASEGEAVGVLLPTAIACVAVVFALSSRERIPALLNYTLGAKGLLSACRTGQIKTVLTARRFIEMGKLEEELAALQSQVQVVFLEDVAASIGPFQKISALLHSHRLKLSRLKAKGGDQPAAVLFTSGSEGEPKGVVLSHRNLLSNWQQLVAKIDFNGQDRVFNALPLFHSFGLSIGTLTPLLSGMYSFLYPSPLHYKIIPEVAYDINATILFGTNTFLSGYAKHAHPYDFYSVRYAFAGAEKLMPETRRVWSDKFGIRLMEGYGVTETSPVLSVNTAMHFKAGSVGRLLPGIRYQLESVDGISSGGRLHVYGPNIMLGYWLPSAPAQLAPPSSIYGAGWHDTGDLVEVDDEGYLYIKGRVKRFAKLGGEMVSLGAVEELVEKLWPGHLHVAASQPDPNKGERILLVTNYPAADRHHLLEHVRQSGYSELYLPKSIHYLENIPLLATGKIDYQGVMAWLKIQNL